MAGGGHGQLERERGADAESNSSTEDGGGGATGTQNSSSNAANSLFQDLKLKWKRVRHLLSESDSPPMSDQVTFTQPSECDQQSDVSSGSDSAYVSDRTSDFDTGPPPAKKSKSDRGETESREKGGKEDEDQASHGSPSSSAESSPSEQPGNGELSASRATAPSSLATPSLSLPLPFPYGPLSVPSSGASLSSPSPLTTVASTHSDKEQQQQQGRATPPTTPSPGSGERDRKPCSPSQEYRPAHSPNCSVPSPMILNCPPGYLMQLSGGFAAHHPSGPMKLIPMMSMPTSGAGMFPHMPGAPMFLAASPDGSGCLLPGISSTTSSETHHRPGVSSAAYAFPSTSGSALITYPTLDGPKMVNSEDVLRLEQPEITINTGQGYPTLNFVTTSAVNSTMSSIISESSNNKALASPGFKQPKREESRIEKDSEFISHYTKEAFVYRGHLAENPHNMKPRPPTTGTTPPGSIPDVALKAEDSDNEDPLVCAICNDKATGLHYGIVTCEG